MGGVGIVINDDAASLASRWCKGTSGDRKKVVRTDLNRF
jgi:hypothetical protein